MSHSILAPVKFVLSPGPWAIGEDGFKRGVPFAYQNIPSSMDARAVRTELLKVTDKESCAAFLNNTGYVVIFDDRAVHPLNPGHVSDVLLSHITEWRDVCHDLLRAKHDVLADWVKNPRYNGTVRHYAYQGTGIFNALPVGFSWDRPGKPALTVTAQTALEAAVISCHLDRLAGLRFKQCRRPDCGSIYEVETRQRRFYCTPECAHLETVRRGRRNAKKVSRRLKKGGKG
jgi:hypothetical protein